MVQATPAAPAATPARRAMVAAAPLKATSVAGALARAGTFKWLARWFLAPPDLELVTSLNTAAARRVLGLPRRGQIGNLSGPAAVEELAILWTRLFSAPGPDQVPPYESVYRDRAVIDLPDYPEFEYRGGRVEVTGQLYGDSNVQGLLSYAEADFVLESTWGVLGDHLGVELSFMALTCAGEAAARAAGDGATADLWQERGRRFLRTHLAQWVPAFAGRLGERAAGTLFQRLAEVVAWFVDSELGGAAAGPGQSASRHDGQPEQA